MKPMDRERRLEGGSIYLRPITAQDTELVLSWRNSRRVVENFIYREHISRQEHMSWLENKVFAGKVHQFVICGASDDTPFGSVYLQNFDEANNKAEWGLFLGGEAPQGKGVGTQTGFLILDYAFGELGLHKLCSRVLARNKPCIRMNEKLGYRQEAYLKEELLIDGKYEDLICYGTLKGEIRR
ncbi:MAG: GNAT family N-acetyltransferase [Lachnospiraceae bacterium]|nr:GNAT family N-acetyltransferase [Lachnospiraceae bacterium]